MRSVLKITQSAGKQLVRIAKENQTTHILFYVKGGGCNGFNYKFLPTNDKPEKFDEVVPYEGVNIVIDSTSVMHLLGTEIDWKKTVMGETFHFTNPNAIANCGCGTSFSV